MSGAFHQALRDLRYLRPIRTQPTKYQEAARGFDLQDDSHGRFLFEQIAALGLTGSGQAMLNNWVKEFEIPYEFVVEDLGNSVVGRLLAMRATDLSSGLEVTLPDIGFGISQLLPIIVAGIAAAGKIIAVEQPELHLHPRQQGHLADFMNASLWDLNDDQSWHPARGEADPRLTQWIVETHSEALISRFQRRVREKKLDPRDISVIFVERSAEGARLRELRLDERGEFHR